MTLYDSRITLASEDNVDLLGIHNTGSLKLTDNGGSGRGGSGSGGSGSGGGATAKDDAVAQTYAQFAAKCFNDVNETDYFANAVGRAREKGITTGIDAVTFGPNFACTREQVVTFLWRSAGCPEPKLTDCVFTDVDANEYYYKAMLWAIENNITNGISETEFGTGDSCSNGYIITFLNRAMTGKIETPAEGGEWWSGAYAWANGNKLLDGTYAGSFDVSADAPRANIVEYLYRYFNK